MLLLAGDAAYVLTTFRNAVRELPARLDGGGNALADRRVEAAQEYFSGALHVAHSVSSATAHPAFWIAKALPWTSSDARAVEALADSAELGATAGLDAAAVVRTLGLDADGQRSPLFFGGRVDIEAIRESAQGTAEIERLLERGKTLLAESPAPRFGSVKSALERARDRVAESLDRAERTRILLAGLPGLLGGDEERRYLLAFQTLSEARGTGGLVGLFGVLSVTDGRVKLERVASFGRLGGPALAELDAPKWYRQRYRGLLDLSWGGQWQGANFTPDFPAAARVFLQLYEASTGDRLDGVIAMGPVTLARLTTATGPLKSSAIVSNLDNSNTARVLLHDVYVAFDTQDAQNRYLAEVTRTFWRKLVSKSTDPIELAEGLSDVVASNHFKVYLPRPEEGAIVDEFGASGAVPQLNPNLQVVWSNNTAARKVDFFSRRSIDTKIELTPEGDADVTTTLALSNLTPQGAPPDLLVGTADQGLPPGYNRMQLNFLLPKEAAFEKLTVRNKPVDVSTGEEAGFPVVWRDVILLPGDHVSVMLRYRVPHAVHEDSFAFTLWPQATVRFNNYRVHITAPDGFALLPAGRPQEDARRSLSVSGLLDRETTVEARLVPR